MRNRHVKDVSMEVYGTMEDTIETLRDMEAIIGNLKDNIHKVAMTMTSDMKDYHKEEYNLNDYMLPNLISLLNRNIQKIEDLKDTLKENYIDLETLSRE